MSEPHHSLTAEGLGHGLRRMTGRDPDEQERAATPLELLFDLVFVVGFGQAANGLAHAVAHDHVTAGLIGFAFGMFAIVWAWINFTWFASAYDTDDWAHRLSTMVIMIGAVVLALGISPMFTSLEETAGIDNTVMVAGYVIMRVPMVGLWLRAKAQASGIRDTVQTYVTSILVSQAGWVVLAVVDTSVATFFLAGAGLLVIELGGPWWAETRHAGTPWHPHHVAERYGLLAIIALGEGIIGTVAAVSALVAEVGWTFDGAMVAVAGVSLTFGLWWGYFAIPFGEFLRHRRETSFGWGYGHLLVYAPIAAIGAGLHVAALVLEEEAEVSAFVAVMAIVVPLAVFMVVLYTMYAGMVGEFDPLHVQPLVASVVVLGVAAAMAATGVALHWTLLVITLVPWITVVAYETHGRDHQAAMLERMG